MKNPERRNLTISWWGPQILVLLFFVGVPPKCGSYSENLEAQKKYDELIDEASGQI